MRHPNEVFGPEAILNHVWSSESEASPDTVRVHITRLRSKIDGPGEKSLIHTIHRVGYRSSRPLRSIPNQLSNQRQSSIAKTSGRQKPGSLGLCM